MRRLFSSIGQGGPDPDDVASRRHSSATTDPPPDEIGSVAREEVGHLAANGPTPEPVPGSPHQLSHQPDLVQQIHRRMIQMFAIVEEAIAGATHALLTGDRERARALVANDVALDDLYVELQELVHDRVVAGGLTPAETTWLLSVLSMIPELERSGDLAEHVAQRATRNLPAEIPARLRGYIERMGEVACDMWKMAADAYADHLASAERIDLLDDEMDDLHVQFIAEIAEGSVAIPVAIELALLGRFYERLGDHAVNLTRHVPRRLRQGTAGTLA